MEYSLKDKIILNIALIISFLGLLSLFFIMFFQVSTLMQINEIPDDQSGKIALSGIARNFSYINGNTRFRLYQECNIEVIAFNQQINASNVYLEGKIQEYKGKKTIIADKITAK